MLRLRAVLLALGLAAALACGAGDGLAGAAPALDALLEAMPASAAARGLYFTDQTAVDGFGSALPLAGDAPEAFGFAVVDADALLESGAPPVTALRGGFAPDAVRDGFTAQGYAASAEGGWTVFTRPAAAPPGAHPDAVLLPAAALRGDVLVLGTADEVAAATRGHVAAGTPWAPRLARAAGPDAALVALGPPPAALAARAAAAGTTLDALLSRAGAAGDLAAYDGFALAWPAAGAGVLAVAYPPGVDGDRQAEALALRLATAPVVDAPARGLADELDPGAARWHDEARVAVVPLRADAPEPETLRADLEEGRLLFLAPPPKNSGSAEGTASDATNTTG
jgi:hypothetical protein